MKRSPLAPEPSGLTPAPSPTRRKASNPCAIERRPADGTTAPPTLPVGTGAPETRLITPASSPVRQKSINHYAWKVTNPYAKERRRAVTPNEKERRKNPDPRAEEEEEVRHLEEIWRPFSSDVPPDADARKIRFVVFDLETHGWLDLPLATKPGIEGRPGAFGHRTWAAEASLNFSRMVQVGWRAYGRDGGLIRSESRIISDVPGGIQPQAAKYHKITNAMADEKGVPLGDAVRDVLADLAELDANGGTLVGHHLEFDAGIFLREMRRVGCPAGRLEAFRRIAAGGTCTMDDAVRATGGQGYWGRPSLDMCHEGFVLGGFLSKDSRNRHSAEDDARITWEVFVALRRRAHDRSARAVG